MIKFTCPGCGMPFEVDDAHAGREGTCPRCASPFRTPSPGGSPQLGPNTDAFPTILPVPADALRAVPPAAPSRGIKLEKPVAGGAAGAAAPARPPSDRQVKKPSDRQVKKPSDRQVKKPSDRQVKKARPGKKAGRSKHASGSGEDESPSSRFRAKKSSSVVPLAFAFFVLAGLSGLIGVAAHKALSAKKPGDGVATVVTKTPGVTPKRPTTKRPKTNVPKSSDPQEIRKRLEDLLLRLEEIDAADVLTEEKERVESARRDYEELASGPMPRNLRSLLRGAELRLEALERRVKSGKGRSTGGGVQPPPQDRDEARVQQAWLQISKACQRLLGLALRQPSASFQAGAESRLGGPRFRERLFNELWDAAQGEPEEVLDLALKPEWTALLGVGGYDALDRASTGFPADLKGHSSWKRWEGKRAKLRELRARAETFAAGIQLAWKSWIEGDHAGARAAFKGLPKDDVWGRAMRDYLDQPIVATAFASRRKGGGGSAKIPGVAPAPPGGSTARSLGAGGNWRERFEEQVGLYKKGGDERPSAIEEMAVIVAFTASLAKRSFHDCDEAVTYFDEHRRLLKKEPTLAERLLALHEVYFAGALQRCSGPSTFHELDAWCKANDHEAWRERLAPFLELVKTQVGTPGREKPRAQRAKTIRAVRRFAAKRIQGLVDGMGELLGWMREATYAEEAAKAELDGILSRAVERAGDPVAGARLRAELARIPHSVSGEEASKLQKTYSKKVDKLIKSIVGDSIKATDRAIKAREPGLAFDLFQYVLLLDPENDRAHKALGHIKVKGQWLRRYRAQQLKNGYAWDDRLAWVRVKDRERYAKGEVLDLATQSWAPLAEANRTHSDPANPWVITTEHFELRTTAALHRGAWIARRLEAYYLNMFRQYDLFFAQKGGAALIFGLSPAQQKPMVVNLYKDRAQYNAYADPIPGSAGYYSPAKHASFFYDEGEDVATLQHEITHQILGENSPGAAHAWLAEGAAVYLQYAFFQDGVLTLGDMQDNPRVMGYKRGLPSGSEHSFLATMGLESQEAWNAGLSAKNYSAAGAAVYFLCNFDGGRYRADFVEMLRDGYRGKRVRVEDYMNLPRKTLDALSRQFYGAP